MAEHKTCNLWGPYSGKRVLSDISVCTRLYSFNNVHSHDVQDLYKGNWAQEGNDEVEHQNNFPV